MCFLKRLILVQNHFFIKKIRQGVNAERNNEVEYFTQCGRNKFSNQISLKSKRASIATGPLLTNPLNSCTKLQICTTLQNYFLGL